MYLYSLYRETQYQNYKKLIATYKPIENLIKPCECKISLKNNSTEILTFIKPISFCCLQKEVNELNLPCEVKIPDKKFVIFPIKEGVFKENDLIFH